MQIDTITRVTDAEATVEIDSVAIRVRKPSGNQVTLTSDDSVVGQLKDERLLNLASLRAGGTLTIVGTGSADETITIGSTVYTLKAAPTAANEVDIGADATGTAANLVAAINLSGTEDTEYGAGTVVNPDVTASAAAGVVTVTAKEAGEAGNLIATTETSADASWGAAVLAGGEDLPLAGLKKLLWPKERAAI